MGTIVDKKNIPRRSRDRARRFGIVDVKVLRQESEDRCTHPFCDWPNLSLQAHHIVHHARGGITHPMNGLMLCLKCHRLLHAGFMPSRFVFAVKQRLVDPSSAIRVQALDADELLRRTQQIRSEEIPANDKFALLNDVLIDANFLSTYAAKCYVLARTLLVKASVLNDGSSPVRSTLEHTLRSMDSRRAWAQILARNAIRYAVGIRDHWSAIRGLHAIAVGRNARNHFPAAVAAHRTVLRYMEECKLPRSEHTALSMHRGRILREMAVCMAKRTAGSTAAWSRVLVSMELAGAVGDPHDIDDACIRCCETATFLGNWRQAYRYLEQLHGNWSRMDSNLKAITMKLAARLAVSCGDESTAWETIARGRAWSEAHGLHHQTYHFARLAWNLEAAGDDSRQMILT